MSYKLCPAPRTLVLWFSPTLLYKQFTRIHENLCKLFIQKFDDGGCFILGCARKSMKICAGGGKFILV